VSPVDSSRSVTGSRVESSDPCDPPRPAACPEVAPEVEPFRHPAASADPPPSTSDEAIKLAIKLAVDAGDFERAAALLDVAKRTAPRTAPIVTLAERRERK
jgi:hypothetical protein